MKKTVFMMLMAVGLMMPSTVVIADEKADKIVAAYEAWLKKSKVKKGAIAVSFKGELVASGGRGRKADEMAPVASLSKAITATCVTHALKQNGKRLSDSLGDLLPKYLEGKKKPRDKRFLGITVQQLMTHNSGVTIYVTKRGMGELKSAKYENLDWQYKTTAKAKLSGEPGRKYEYNNMNYMLLGLVINEVSGESHEEYCLREILAPLGMTRAKLNPDWLVMSAWGAWMMSAEDYLKFANWAFGGNQILGKNPLYSSPKADRGRGRYYGTGVIFRQTKSGFNFWHDGKWGGNRKKRAGFGALFSVYDNDYSFVVNYSKLLSGKQSAALDSLMYKVSH